MEEKNSTPEVVETVGNSAAAKTAPRSFRCISEPMDKRIIAISFLTAVITVLAYHFSIIAVEYFCDDEEEPVYCYCHRIVASDESEDDGEESRRDRKDFKGKKGGFFQKMSPEMREKIRNMSPEERREFFAKLRKKRQSKEFPDRSRRIRSPRAERKQRNNAEDSSQE
ncbi:MAG: hypothetical protein E7042_08345 [Lentisphaerae bacterium]|nr:hypothetical protein [Lentisphaerota bacterium]